MVSNTAWEYTDMLTVKKEKEDGMKERELPGSMVLLIKMGSRYLSDHQNCAI
jgi:hypothetical protein